MNQQYVSAVFDTQSEAQQAVTQLRSAGVGDRAISLMTQNGGKYSSTDGTGQDDDPNGNQGFLGRAALASAPLWALPRWPSPASAHWLAPVSSPPARCPPWP